MKTLILGIFVKSNLWHIIFRIKMKTKEVAFECLGIKFSGITHNDKLTEFLEKIGGNGDISKKTKNLLYIVDEIRKIIAATSDSFAKDIWNQKETLIEKFNSFLCIEATIVR